MSANRYIGLFLNLLSPQCFAFNTLVDASVDDDVDDPWAIAIVQ